MNTNLQKRLEEAAKKYAKKVVPECISSYEDFFNNTTADFRNGAEYGYKEAIALAKEWLDSNSENYLGLINEEKLTASTFRTAQLITDFETFMNKLWEDRK